MISARQLRPIFLTFLTVFLVWLAKPRQLLKPFLPDFSSTRSSALTMSRIPDSIRLPALKKASAVVIFVHVGSVLAAALNHVFNLS